MTTGSKSAGSAQAGSALIAVFSTSSRISPSGRVTVTVTHAARFTETGPAGYKAARVASMCASPAADSRGSSPVLPPPPRPRPPPRATSGPFPRPRPRLPPPPSPLWLFFSDMGAEDGSACCGIAAQDRQGHWTLKQEFQFLLVWEQICPRNLLLPRRNKMTQLATVRAAAASFQFL